MGDSLITVVVIALVAVLMFVFPLMTMSDRTDDVSQLTVDTATTEFVDNVRTTGKLTLDNYGKYVENISSTGNAYDVEMEINVYYSMYTSQILDQLNDKKVITLKEGDIISLSAKNKTSTLSQQLKNFFYSVAGNDTYSIAAEHAGIVTANGTGK